MPHDSNPTAPVMMPLPHIPTTPTGLVDGLVRAVPADATDGTEAVLDSDVDDERVAAFLAGAAHSDAGFVVRTSSPERAVAIVAATAAALCGEDIRSALRAPDIEFLRGLGSAAVEALRGVLLAIESDIPDEVVRGLRVLSPDIPQTGGLPATPQ